MTGPVGPGTKTLDPSPLPLPPYFWMEVDYFVLLALARGR